MSLGRPGLVGDYCRVYKDLLFAMLGCSQVQNDEQICSMLIAFPMDRA
jgi:hypothetical protein